jgi:hypothetical protein
MPRFWTGFTRRVAIHPRLCTKTSGHELDHSRTRPLDRQARCGISTSSITGTKGSVTGEGRDTGVSGGRACRDLVRDLDPSTGSAEPRLDHRGLDHRYDELDRRRLDHWFSSMAGSRPPPRAHRRWGRRRRRGRGTPGSSSTPAWWRTSSRCTARTRSVRPRRTGARR